MVPIRHCSRCCRSPPRMPPRHAGTSEAVDVQSSAVAVQQVRDRILLFSSSCTLAVRRVRPLCVELDGHRPGADLEPPSLRSSVSPLAPHSYMPAWRPVRTRRRHNRPPAQLGTHDRRRVHAPELQRHGNRSARRRSHCTPRQPACTPVKQPTSSTHALELHFPPPCAAREPRSVPSPSTTPSLPPPRPWG